MKPIRINLLVPREASVHRTVRRSIAAALLAGIAASATAYAVLEHLNARQKERNAVLQTALQRIGTHHREAAANSRLKNDLARRAHLAAQADAARFDTLRLLDTLNRLMPPESVLTELADDNGGYLVRGFAQSETQIAELMRLLAAEPLFAETRLIGITHTHGRSVPQFAFRIQTAFAANAASGETP